MPGYTVTIVRDGIRQPAQAECDRKPLARPFVDVAARPPRTYYAKRLLEHGPLRFEEFHAITGWPSDKASRVLNQLFNTGIAKLDGGAWRLTDAV